MDKLTPISWIKLVQKLSKLDFEGPYYGGRHPYMIKGNTVLTIPNPHKKEIGADLLSRILKQGGIERKEWLREE